MENAHTKEPLLFKNKEKRKNNINIILKKKETLLEFSKKNKKSSKKTLLKDFVYDKKILDQIISDCKKVEYTRKILSNLIDSVISKYPERPITGGNKGFIKYMTTVAKKEPDYFSK